MADGDIGEDNLLGAYCHVSIPLGPLAPLIVYFWKGKENKELGFQAKQALVYQIIFWIILIGGGFVATILSAVVIAIVGDIGGLLGLAIGGIYLIILLIFAILAILAAWKTYNKKSYEYPLIGKMLR
jgi:uncharacterized Tic20 family protein